MCKHATMTTVQEEKASLPTKLLKLLFSQVSAEEMLFFPRLSFCYLPGLWTFYNFSSLFTFLINKYPSIYAHLETHTGFQGVETCHENLSCLATSLGFWHHLQKSLRMLCQTGSHADVGSPLLIDSLAWQNGFR